MGDRRGTHRILVRTSEEDRPLGKPRRRYENIITMHPENLDGEAWTGLI
jgi:hypothetical protein